MQIKYVPQLKLQLPFKNFKLFPLFFNFIFFDLPELVQFQLMFY